MQTLKDLLEFVLEQKKWWLLPMLIVMIIVGLLIVFASGSAISPLLYTLF